MRLMLQHAAATAGFQSELSEREISSSGNTVIESRWYVVVQSVHKACPSVNGVKKDKLPAFSKCKMCTSGMKNSRMKHYKHYETILKC
jgi:hypothetical protein